MTSIEPNRAEFRYTQMTGVTNSPAQQASVTAMAFSGRGEFRCIARNQGVAARRRSTATLRTGQSPQATKPGAKDTRPTDRISQVDTTFNGTQKTLASNITYLPFGPLTGLTYGNNLSLVQTYDTQYRISTITAGSVLNLTYDHDAAGNVTSLTDAYNTPSMVFLENPAEYWYDGTSDKLLPSMVTV